MQTQPAGSKIRRTDNDVFAGRYVFSSETSRSIHASAQRQETYVVHAWSDRSFAGRLYQVEYAIAAIQNAAAAIGIQTKHGIVVATEKKVISKLLAPPKGSDKVYKLDDHMFTAVAGLTSDANILINYARLAAQRYKYTYDEDQPVEQLVQLLCDYKHGYTQYGGLRPFGVSFLYAGWDRHFGYQLYQSDPSGNYRYVRPVRTLYPFANPACAATLTRCPLLRPCSGWKATAIGANAQSAMGALKTEYREDLQLEEALRMALKVLTKAMDTTSPSAEKLEVATLVRDATSGRVVQRILAEKEVAALLTEIQAQAAPAGDV